MQQISLSKNAQRALKRLARPGMVLRPDARGGFSVSASADARRRAAARVNAAEARAMASAGLIDQQADEWRISDDGRAFLEPDRTGGAHVQPELVLSRPEEIMPEPGAPQSNALRRLRAVASAEGKPWFEPSELQAAARFERDYRLAQLMGRVTADWSAPPMGRSVRSAPGAGMGPDAAIDARARLQSVRASIGMEAEALLVDVFGAELGLEDVESRRRWPARSAKVALKMALSALAAAQSNAKAA